MTWTRGLKRTLPLASILALVVGLTACGGNGAGIEDTQPSSAPAQSPSPATTAPAPTEQPEDTETGIVGAVVSFTAGDVVVSVVIEEDNPTTRSFLAMLPMTLEFSDYGGKEKVATPTGEWDFTDAERLDPAVGDLFSYMPWGNLGFFYNTDGNTFDSSLTKIGRTDDVEQIELLDGQQVAIDIAG